MRVWETLFLGLLVFHHVSLLVPRYRRPVILTWLAPLAAVAAIVTLAVEGLRWTDLPPLTILLLDLVWLMLSMKGLRGRFPKKKFWPRVGSFLRMLIASIFFLATLAGVSLAFWFPLPTSPAPTGYSVALRTLVGVNGPSAANCLWIWYPAEGSLLPALRPIQTEAAWLFLADKGGPAPIFDSHWALLGPSQPPSLIEGGRLATPARRFPLVVFVPPADRQPWEYEFLLENLASQGFIVASLGQKLRQADQIPNLAQELLELRQGIDFDAWIRREQRGRDAPSGAVLPEAQKVRALVLDLANQPSDIFYRRVATDLTAVWNTGSEAVDVAPLGRDHFAALVTPLAKNVAKFPVVLQVPYFDQKPTMNQPDWTLTVTGLHPADLTDMAFLKPFLFLFHLKGGLSAQPQMLTSAYTGAFLSQALYGSDTDVFSSRSPKINGATLQGP